MPSPGPYRDPRLSELFVRYWDNALTDAEGNAYQNRRLDDGSTHEVLKNFPSPQELQARLERFGNDVRCTEYEYYWLATYRIMAA